MRKALLAVLVTAGAALGQTAIYRSVQPGVTAAIGTGTGTLTISGSTATFSVSQPDSVGVGDAIQYDSDGNSSIDAICFIHGRTSGTEYTVKNAAGAEPTAVTGDEDWDIFRAYTSAQNVDSGTENSGIDVAVRAFDGGNRNIITANEIWNVACYPGTDGSFQFDGWTTSPTNYFLMFTPYLPEHVGRSMRHEGVFWDSQCYRIHSTSTYGVRLTGTAGSSYGFKLDGLQISYSAATGYAVDFEAFETNAKLWLSNCLIQRTGTVSTSAAIRLNNDADRTGYIWNNIILGASQVFGIDLQDNGGIIYAYNNTIVNCTIGIKRTATGNTTNVTNNIVQATTCFSGTFATGNYNLSSDASAPGANSVLSTTLTFQNSGSQDYHLTSADATTAIGTDLSGDANLPFSTDIDGNTRTTWNMGADEFQAEPSVSGGDFFLRRRVAR